MTAHSSVSIPQPKDWQDFERNARILFECILNDPGVKNNGVQGQRQCGVDIYGRQDGKGTAWVGIQCKGKKAGLGKKVRKAELRKEVAEALKFTPPLARFILITTASDDVKIDQEARLITHEHQEKGVPFTVEVWGWDTLEARISEHSRAIMAFSPDSTPFTNQILENQEESKNQILAEIRKIGIQFGGNTVAEPVDKTSETMEILDRNLHAEIDNYRDFFLAGKPLTALRLLESLKKRIWESASDRIKFRIITNIGSCKLHLSREKEQEAIEHFLEAIKYQPEDKVALANVALAYLLQGEQSKAINAAQIALKKHEDNAEAASYLIQAHIQDTNVDNPSSLVPKSVRYSASVYIACINFYRMRSDKQWLQVAREAGERHQENEQIIRFVAEAELESALTTKGLLAGEKSVYPVDYQALSRAAMSLQTLWNKQYNSELPGIDSSLPYNLTQAYRTIGDSASAKAVIVQALDKMPDALDLIKLRAGFYFEEGQPQETLLLLKKNSTDPECVLIAAQILAETDPVSALTMLENFKDTADGDPHHRLLVGQLRIDCFLTHPTFSSEEKITRAKEESDALCEQYPERPLALLIRSQVLEAAGENIAVKKALDTAKSLLKKDSSFYDRIMLAKRFEVLGSYADVVDILNGYVDASHDSPALRMLFFALINADQRAQASGLLSSLPAQVAEQAVFLRGAASLHLRRGDYPAAEIAIDKLLKINPSDLSTHLSRVNIWLRNRDDDAVKAFLTTEVEKLEGKPEERMRLAHLLERFGFYERALKLGYKIHLQNARNPEVQLAYIGLLLRPEAAERINLKRTTVGIDTVFTVKNALGETETYTIEADENLHFTAEQVLPGHAFAAAATGLQEGQKFHIHNREEWEIVSVKHKYLHALHIRMEHFERHFPDSSGLQRFTIKSEDGIKSFEPMLKQIKERHDFAKLILDTYSEFPLPLEAFAQHIGSDVIDLWYSITQMGGKFKACTGNYPERAAAIRYIEENDKAGCVVDALTLHIIRTLGIEETIAAICGPISATESTIDTFRQRREQILSYGGQSFMTLYWRDGQYFREEITAERLAQILSNINKELDWIDQHITVIPAESHGLISDEARRIRDVISYSFLDPLLAAQEANRLLLCEDQSYRQFGMAEFNIKASWLQPILMVAAEKGMLPRERYCEIVCALVDAGHSFTSIDPHILLYALRNSETRFEKVAKTLFGLNAEIISNLKVVVAFLYSIWTGKAPLSSEQKATSILLRRIFFGEWRSNFPEADLRNILLLLRENFSHYRFNSYLSNWLSGHFVTGFEAHIQKIDPPKTHKKRKRK